MAYEPTTAAWLRGQWQNPGDIFTILLIIGGDIVQVAIAQLCAGPVPGLTPVTFSFGWVTYAISAMLSAVGDNRLMPKPELNCQIINASSGYARTNNSWVLSRILRDFDFWMDPDCEEAKVRKLEELRAENRQAKEPKPESAIRVGLRVTVWSQVQLSRPRHDVVYWAGIGVASVQIALAAVPWGLHGEWLTLMVTGAGTLLALASGALPQWKEEKFINRTATGKNVFLTTGNGASDAILVLGCDQGMDLEALASPDRDWKANQNSTRALSFLLAVLWTALLISVAGFEEHTWYLLGVGIIGILHNVAVAGMPRQPGAFGIELHYERTIVEQKVMSVLWQLEEHYPKTGKALIETFFPGELRLREQKLWEYAVRRQQASKKDKNKSKPRWKMPPLVAPDGYNEVDDIPTEGEYMPVASGIHQVFVKPVSEVV